ncbi:hypothetical protein PJO24_004973 [Salmonella enterica]|nr:hypothetical protein [Salmonella enterica]
MAYPEIKKPIKSVIFQRITETVNHDTGVLKKDVDEQVLRYNPEPPYVKIYIDDLCSIVNAPGALKDVLFLILRKLDYDGYIALSTRYRREMCSFLGIKDGTLRNRLAALVKQGIISSCGGNEYMANPNLFARGDWKSIIEQRRDFELKIRYTADGQKTITTVPIEVSIN